MSPNRNNMITYMGQKMTVEEFLCKHKNSGYEKVLAEYGDTQMNEMEQYLQYIVFFNRICLNKDMEIVAIGCDHNDKPTGYPCATHLTTSDKSFSRGDKVRVIKPNLGPSNNMPRYLKDDPTWEFQGKKYLYVWKYQIEKV